MIKKWVGFSLKELSNLVDKSTKDGTNPELTQEKMVNYVQVGGKCCPKCLKMMESVTTNSENNKKTKSKFPQCSNPACKCHIVLDTTNSELAEELWDWCLTEVMKLPNGKDVWEQIMWVHEFSKEKSFREGKQNEIEFQKHVDKVIAESIFNQIEDILPFGAGFTGRYFTLKSEILNKLK